MICTRDQKSVKSFCFYKSWILKKGEKTNNKESHTLEVNNKSRCVAHYLKLMTNVQNKVKQESLQNKIIVQMTRSETNTRVKKQNV